MALENQKYVSDYFCSHTSKYKNMQECDPVYYSDLQWTLAISMYVFLSTFALKQVFKGPLLCRIYLDLPLKLQYVTEKYPYTPIVRYTQYNDFMQVIHWTVHAFI